MLLAYTIGPLCLLPLWILRDLDLIVDRPLWVYFALLIAPGFTVSAVTNLLYRQRPTRWTLHLRAASDAVATTIVVYATGWGPELGLTYLVAAQQLVGQTSRASWRVVRLWVTLGVVCGQAGIALGWVPSLISRPADQGAAALGLLTFFLVSHMASTVAAERDEAWRALETSGEQFRALVQNSSDLIMVLDEAAVAIYVSGACERLLGRSADELKAVDLAALVHPEDVELVRSCLGWAIVEPGPTAPIELRARHIDGQWRHLEVVGSNLRDNQAVGGMVLNVRDVTDRRRVEAQLAHQATHDALTGLPNRTLFLERLGQCLSGGSDGCRPAVLFLDIDRFKLINDSLGHELGDRLLIDAARRLVEAIGVDDMVARFGGDEFVVLCAAGTDAADLAARLLSTFERPFQLSGQSYFLSASIGVAGPESTDLNPADLNPADLIRDADTAMYRAKEQGRGRLAVFDEAARADALNRVRIEHLLRGAVERAELRLFYQPVLDLRTDRVVGAEALLRWQHPLLGLITPGDFIDAAEETGLIVAIGDWALRTGCEQALTWARRGEAIDLAVNVSARQLADEDFVERVRQAVAPIATLPPGVVSPEITLEITERVLISEPDSVDRRIAELKALGLKLAMDDFGTGYSSLSNLRRYPFDSLKIDRRFVSGVTDRDDDGTIVRAIIALAQGLGKKVIAEGVETQEQLDVLRDLGCDLAQGFHIGKPQPATLSPSDLLALGRPAAAVLSPTG